MRVLLPPRSQKRAPYTRASRRKKERTNERTNERTSDTWTALFRVYQREEAGTADHTGVGRRDGQGWSDVGGGGHIHE